MRLARRPMSYPGAARFFMRGSRWMYDAKCPWPALIRQGYYTGLPPRVLPMAMNGSISA